MWQTLTKPLSLLLSIFLLLSLLAALAWQARSGYEITRVRNALIAHVGTPQDFAWTPDTIPADFRLEHSPLPDKIERSMQQLFDDAKSSDENNSNDWQNALKIAQHLGSGPGVGEGVLGDTLGAYDNILHGSNAYCADFTQVFNGLSYAKAIPVREWGMSFDGYSGWGHAFNEIYDRQNQRWVFIDTFNSFYVIDKSSGQPLSVAQFSATLRKGQLAAIEVKIIEPKRFGFRDAAQALDYYHRGVEQLFLWWGNDVLAYDANSLIHTAGLISRSLEQMTAILLGVYPRMVLLATAENQLAIDRLLAKRSIILGLGFGIGLLSLLVFIQSVILFRRRRHRRHRRHHRRHHHLGR